MVSEPYPPEADGRGAAGPLSPSSLMEAVLAVSFELRDVSDTPRMGPTTFLSAAAACCCAPPEGATFISDCRIPVVVTG